MTDPINDPKIENENDPEVDLKIDHSEIRKIFIEDRDLLDVRAPIEFAKGSFPAAVNLPILNDDERHQVGLCYKEKGAADAEQLGYQLVSGSIKQTRLEAWKSYLDSHPEATLFCFRGGSRSKITQEWLRGEGIQIDRVQGGYKVMRSFLIDVYEHLPPLKIVSGQTGVGKTEFLHTIEDSLDLEGYANHRGSAFGHKITPQPSQIDFENSVSIQFLKMQGRQTILEDEGRLIGRVSLPPQLQAAMKSAPLLLLEDSIDNRIQRIKKEYVEDGLSELQQTYTDKSDSELKLLLLEKFETAIQAIKKRLGGVAFDAIQKRLRNAFEMYDYGDSSGHDAWIQQLLVDYYDPMYNYQLEQKQERIIQRGNQETIGQYLGQAHIKV